MEQSLEHKVVMEYGRNTEVLGRLAHVDVATAAYNRPIPKGGTSPCT